MDNSIAKLLDLFKHLARDIIIYVLPGFVLIFNFIIVDKLYLGNKLINILNTEYLLLIFFILSYLVGHVIMAFMSILFKILNMFKCKKDGIDFEKELKIFKMNYQVYEYFIERENHLYFLRWNLSGGFLISAIFNVFFMIQFSFEKEFSYYFIFIPIIVGVILLRLHYVTKRIYKEKIEKILKEYI